MTEKQSKRPKPVSLLLDVAATTLAVLVLAMDGSAFLFWISLGVFDNHWKDIPLQVLFVCMIISYLFLLLVAAMFGLARRLSEQSEKTSISVLGQLGALIDEGWDKALRVASTCSMVVLAFLVAACLGWWRDLLWWTQMSRGLRAENEHRSQDAIGLYQNALEVGTADRAAVSQVMLANVAYDSQELEVADRYFNQAIAAVYPPNVDNRSLLITAYQGLVKTLLLEHKYKLAETDARKCLTIYNQLHGPLPPIYLRLVGDIWLPSTNAPPTLEGTYTLLQEACVRLGNYEEAQKTFTANLADLEKRKGISAYEFIPVTNLFLDVLAEVKPLRLDLLDAAVGAARQALLDKYGENCPAVIGLLTKYGDRLVALGHPERAEQCFLKAIEIGDAAKVEDFMILRAMNGLATIYASRNQLEKADEVYKGELALREGWKKTSSDVDIETNTCRSDYAALLRRMNRDDEANKIQSANSGKIRQE